MEKNNCNEVFYIRNLGYEVEIRKDNKTVSVGRGKTEREALANAIQGMEKEGEGVRLYSHQKS